MSYLQRQVLFVRQEGKVGGLHTLFNFSVYKNLQNRYGYSVIVFVGNV